LGFLADTINSLGKLARVDRTVEVFSADAESGALLGLLLEAKRPDFVADPGILGDRVLEKAVGLVNDLTGLFKTIREGEAVLKEAKPAPTDPPSAADIADLRDLIDSAKVLAAALDVTKNTDALWAAAKALSLRAALEGKNRLFLDVKGRAILITESRWFWSDRLISGGELQVAYRLCDTGGQVLKSGLILKASEPERVKLNKLSEAAFSAKSVDPVKK
jgi:hypothetical protein